MWESISMSLILGVRTATTSEFQYIVTNFKKKLIMTNNNDNDLVDQLNRLLEWLHQSDGQHIGSHITLIKVEKGAQYDHSPTLEPPELPEPLATPEAMVLWQKAQQAGYVNEHFQPLLSRTLSAILAFEMAKRLDIRNKWKLFGALWNRQNMRGDYNDALNQRQTLGFQDSLKKLFAD